VVLIWGCADADVLHSCSFCEEKKEFEGTELGGAGR
jgi:hypothetical protein